MVQLLSVNCKVGEDLLEPGVLVLQRLTPAHIVRQQTAIPLHPVEVGGLSDPGLLAELDDRCSVLTLLQYKRHLRLRDPGCLHRLQLLSDPESNSRKLQLQTVQFSRGKRSSKTVTRG